MSNSAYYIQECSTCGRTLQIRVKYLGKKVTCQHCGASFRAADPGCEGSVPIASGKSLLARAEKLLETAARETAGFASGSGGEC